MHLDNVIMSGHYNNPEKYYNIPLWVGCSVRFSSHLRSVLQGCSVRWISTNGGRSPFDHLGSIVWGDIYRCKCFWVYRKMRALALRSAIKSEIDNSLMISWIALEFLKLTLLEWNGVRSRHLVGVDETCTGGKGGAEKLSSRILDHTFKAWLTWECSFCESYNDFFFLGTGGLVA